MKQFSVIILLFLFAISQFAYSQGFHTSNNRALKVYNEGLAAYDFFDFKKAEADFREAVKLDEGFYESYMMLGELFSKQKRYAEASENFRKAVSLDSLFFKPVYFSLAYAELMSGDYQNALIHFNVYLAQSGMSEKNRIIAIKNVKNCEFALKAIENPVLFNPVSVGNTINTPDDEYWPSITADGNMLMFTRQLNPADRQNRAVRGHEDFYVSHSSEHGWKEAFNAGTPLNTSQNEGAPSISSNGNYMFFTACDRRGGVGSCDIYFSFFNGDRWSEPFNPGMPVNTSYWESQPSISADGKRLFFSSSRPGGYGGKDLWFSTLNDQNMWDEPINLGSSVNTDGDEMSPFVHFDGKTLYFASDGRPGMGGVDLYMTRMNDDSTWTEPQNLGYPINTYNDEMGLIIESGGSKAYFSSVREKANGKDIFYFNLHESVRPDPVAYLKGKVYDKVTGKLLQAEYELINLSSQTVTIQSSTDENGNFLVCLPSGYNYGINVKKSGYLFYSENFMFEGQHSVVEPYIKKIILSPIREGEKMKLANVFYEVDSWQLKSESISELNNLASLISENKDFVVEIGGYTDSTGTSEYNQQLSEKRARSVVNYLINKGISPERLKYKGYGDTLPVGDNKIPEGRKLNRRTEARILEHK
jgi:outer membrane protein OmpA-like peptidoglycan-associated protein